MNSSIAIGLLWLGSLAGLAIYSATLKLWIPYVTGILVFTAANWISLRISLSGPDGGPGDILVAVFHVLLQGLALLAHIIRWLVILSSWLSERSRRRETTSP